MNIETKYSTEDIVYIITDGRIYSAPISEIQIKVTKNYTKIIYGFIGATTFYREQDECWPSITDFIEASK